MTAKGKFLEPIHPGEILFEEFMKPLGISINQLARDIAVPPGRISAIVNRQRAISRYAAAAWQIFRCLARSMDWPTGRLRSASCTANDRCGS